jgi:hypothetical protein
MQKDLAKPLGSHLVGRCHFDYTSRVLLALASVNPRGSEGEFVKLVPGSSLKVEETPLANSHEDTASCGGILTALFVLSTQYWYIISYTVSSITPRHVSMLSSRCSNVTASPISPNWVFSAATKWIIFQYFQEPPEHSPSLMTQTLVTPTNL